MEEKMLNEVLEIIKDTDELMKYMLKQMNVETLLSMDSEDVKIMKKTFDMMEKSKKLLLLMARKMDRQEEVLLRLDRYLDEQECSKYRNGSN